MPPEAKGLFVTATGAPPVLPPVEVTLGTYGALLVGGCVATPELAFGGGKTFPPPAI